MLIRGSSVNQKSNSSGYFKSSDSHEIFWETKGNISKTPIVFLHGGPGARVMPSHHSLFSEDHFFSIFFDQRGCGKSKPFCELTNNTIQHLVQDMENIREELGIDKWILFGGSWGSTLALYYSINHPERCLGMILRGIFLGSRNEIDWFLTGMGKFYPEAHSLFLKELNFLESENPTSNDIINRASDLICGDDEIISQKVSNAWSSYEMSCSTIDYKQREMTGDGASSMAKIELHYFKNNCFLNDNEILNNIHKVQNVPTYIIQGRHDVICPPFSAYELNSKMPSSELIMVDDAGHSAFETGIKNSLMSALKEIKKKI